MPDGKRILVVMGVSGTGKSTIGTLLAEKLDYPFFDGDDYHPEENIKKMNSGIPLTDDDRKGWLLKLNQIALENRHTGGVIACSALKNTYRGILKAGVGSCMEFVYLEGSFDEVKSRLESREGHFMPIELLQSQFDTLEPPSNATTVSIMLSPEEIVKKIVKQVHLPKSH
ncbi:gluconokinase [Flagellimonas nanhaiensis]|uniref:Gluconokinase n=1 Tax=Flagellimonas nanhaiensis TaxID=2292706 RepID=A0A371JU33_9FLAO|nr:gluconokinase [Allomuricauda nanhaiensis]RDY61330.1 gluconokinase [Allomuricauda nanhaiensis]